MYNYGSIVSLFAGSCMVRYYTATDYKFNTTDNTYTRIAEMCMHARANIKIPGIMPAPEEAAHMITAMQ